MRFRGNHQPLSMTWRLLLWSLVISLVPLALILLISETILIRSYEREANHTVDAVLGIKADRMEAFAAERKDDVLVLSRFLQDFPYFERLKEIFERTGLASEEYVRAESEIHDYLLHFATLHQYDDIFLVTPQGDEFFSLKRRGDLGSNYLKGPYRETELGRVFEQARSESKPILTGFGPFTRSNSRVAFIAASVIDKGVLKGVVILQIGNEALLTMIQDNAGLHRTTENSIVRQVNEQIQVTSPHGSESTDRVGRMSIPLSTAPRPLKDAAMGINGTDISVDNRGIPIITGWKYLPSWKSSLMVKFDPTDVLGDIQRTKRWFLQVGLATLGVVTLLAIYAARSVSLPIVRLTEAARHMARGDLTQTVPVQGGGELKELAESFNAMSAELRSMYENIEDQVRLRTRQQEIVAEVGKMSVTSTDIDLFLNEVLLQAAQTFQVESAAILELRPDGQELTLRSRIGWEGILDELTHVSRSIETDCGYILAQDQPVIIEDMQTEQRFKTSSLFQSQAAVSAIGCVIPDHRQPFGLICIFSRKYRTFDNNDANFIRSLANVIGTTIDRKQAEAALRRSEADLKRAQAVAHLGSWRLDIQTRCLEFSDEMYRLLHLPLSTPMTYDNFLPLVYHEDRDAVDREWKAAEQGKPFSMEYRILFDDQIRWIHSAGEVEFDTNGRPISGIGTARDITERKHNEQQLQNAIDYNRSLFEASPDSLTMIGPDGEITDVNARAAELTGYSRQEIIGSDPTQFFGDPERVRAGIEQVLRTGLLTDYALEARRKDGQLIPVLFSASVLRDEAGQILGIIAAARDNTELKRAEDKLREANNYNRSLFETSPDSLAIIGLDGKVLDANTRAAEIGGNTLQELIDSDCTQFFTDPDRVMAGVKIVLQTGSIRDYALEMKHKDGHTIPVLYNATVLRNEAGQIAGILTSARDVSALKHAENELRQASLYNRSLIDANLDLLATIGLDGKIMDVNANALVLSGYSREELIGSDGAQYFTDPERVRAGIEEALRTGFLRDYALEMRHKDGHTVPVLYNGSVFHDESGQIKGIFAAARDVTALKQAEEALQQTNQALRALSDCNAALFRATDEMELLERVCQIAVTVGGYRMAWVGYVEHDAEKTVRPVAQAGHEAGYLQAVKITWAETEQGNGPAGQAIRSGHPFICQDMANDSFFAPWIEEAKKRGYASTLALPLMTQGKTIGILVIYSPRVNAFGEGQVSILLEISHNLAFGISVLRTRAERELAEERLRGISDSVVSGITILGQEARVEHWNPGAERIFGYSRSESWDKKLHELVLPIELQAQFESSLQTILWREAAPASTKFLELEAIHKKGNRFPIELSLSPVVLRGASKAIVVIRDITERKHVEAELKHAKESAEAANVAKSEFLANMSHEIRTPMNGIIGLAGLLLDTELTAEQRQYLLAVQDSAESLLKIINAILDFSKIEAHMLEMEEVEFDLRDTLDDTVKTLFLRARQKGLEVDYDVRPDIPEKLIGDPVRLRQVMINLIGNAVKFTANGSISVLIKLEQRELGSAHLHFSVRDTGIGIPPDKQRLLFSRFTQADSSTTREFGGTGLGLAISAQLVKLMHGEIWFESQAGQGSQFHFTATFKLPDDQQKSQLQIPSFTSDLRVLLVDNNVDSRHILKEMVASWRMIPIDVDSESAAMKALQDAVESGKPFDLILLKPARPELDGLLLLEAIKAYEGAKRPKVVLLDTGDQSGYESLAREIGAEQLIVPIRCSSLLDTIAKVQGEAWGAKGSRSLPEARPKLPKLRKLKILLAEDNPINQLLAIRTLEKAGHTVLLANNGAEAVAAMERETFDAVLMDVQMPVMDGYEATARIRDLERKTGKHLPIIAMTAHALKGDREICLKAGMDEYVSKPFRNEQLFSALSAVVADSVVSSESANQSLSQTHYANQDGQDNVTLVEQQTVNSNEGSGSRSPKPSEDSLADDPELRNELAQIFLEDTPKLLTEIRDAILKKDGPALKYSAHTLKGSIGVFKDQTAWESALRMEHLGRDCDWAHADDAWEQLNREVTRLSASLKSVQESGSV